LEALYAFKGIEADEDAGIEEETYEDFVDRFRAEYDATDPLIVPVMSLDTFIDTPELCPDSTIEAAQELLDLVVDISDLTAYVAFLNGELQECADQIEDDILLLIAANQPRLTEAAQQKQIELDDLFTFAGLDGESMDQFTDRMFAEFDAHLDQTNWELLDAGIEIPDVSEEELDHPLSESERAEAEAAQDQLE
jgi:hypothetical protein